MGLLSIWDDWRKKQEGSWAARDDFSEMDSDLRPPPKNIYDNNWNKVKNYALGDEKQIGPQRIRGDSKAWSDIKKTGKKVYNALPGGDFDKRWAIEQSQKNKINAAQTNNATPFHPSQGGTSQNLAGNQDLKWWEKLGNMANVDMDKAMANWKEKGGFEGLMANPAFTMGLAFMQAGAEGKTLGAGALDNVMKAGGISQHYKKIIEERKQEPIQATAADISEVESLLKTINIEEGNWAENLISKIKGGHPGAEWSAAVEEIAVKYQEKIAAWQRTHKHPDGRPKTIRQTDKIKIMQNLINSKEIEFDKGNILFAGTIKKKLPGLARGGPVQAGKPYVVGEEGPEIIIPHSSGNVLSNDDSQIYAMLLASNPQLQKVSRVRAEKILRSRFPEYFE